MSFKQSLLTGGKRFSIHQVRGLDTMINDDVLAVEEPLELRLESGTEKERTEKSISITMRTPGHDVELAAGFFYTEGIIHGRSDIEDLAQVPGPGQRLELCNVVRLRLQPDVTFDPKLIERHFYTTSSCGVCGKASLEALRINRSTAIGFTTVSLAAKTLENIASELITSQKLFQLTGGLHAAGLFNPSGQLLCLHEDVGRHNAVDKVIGDRLIKGHLPLKDSVLMVSGRASFEIMQKALMARIPIVAAVSAPSSLAVELAKTFNMTLLGFVRGNKFNIYSGASRIKSGVTPS